MSGVLARTIKMKCTDGIFIEIHHTENIVVILQYPLSRTCVF